MIRHRGLNGDALGGDMVHRTAFDLERILHHLGSDFVFGFEDST
jgi:hypothetical protein